MTMTAQYRPYRDEDGADGAETHLASGWPDHEPTIQIYEKTTESLPYVYRRNRRSLALFLAFTLLVGLFGFLIGYFGHSSPANHCNKVISFSDALQDKSSIIRAKLVSAVRSDNIRRKAREFSTKSHLAGSAEDMRQVQMIREFFESNHFDRIVIKNYTALLSLPDPEKPNFISLVDVNGNPSHYSTLNRGQQPSFFSPYSPKGDVTGDILFVNYGRPVDYLHLQTLLNVTSPDVFSGKIFLAKQYYLSASEQYKYAVAMNASALLLYPDPQHYNPENKPPYPESIWLPSDGVRNDAVFWNGAGDPETFGLPSNEYAFRDASDFEEQMTIPAQPISADTAREIFKRLGGPVVPSDWKGGLNLTYRIGPGLNDNLKVRVVVNNRLKRETVHNVIGTIHGREEPDRYVIIGNQRDSMSKGAIDSAAGTATFLEIARIFGSSVAEGWRPRRSLIFASWGAEEFNLIGSTEFVEDTLKILYMRAVAYININLVVNGNDTLSVAASPLLYHSIFNATKDVYLPKISPSKPEGSRINEYNSIYDKWIVHMPKMRNVSTLIVKPSILDQMDGRGILVKDKHHFHHRQESSEPGAILRNYLESALQEVRPHIRPLDMFGSYAPFYTMSGIPVVDLCFIGADYHDGSEDEIEEFEKLAGHQNHLPYPLLHTQYDEIEALEQFIDPDYKYHATAAQLIIHITERLADGIFLPFNIFDYAQVLKDFYVRTTQMHTVVAIGTRNQHETLETSGQHPDLDLMDLDLKILESAIDNFTQEAIKFHARQDKIDLNDPAMVRQVNDKLLLVERQFLDHRGLPNNHIKRHLILSPAETLNAQLETHEGLFPALLDELDQIMGTVQRKEIQHSLIRLQKHLPILIDTIQSAAESLAFSGDFF